jgi:hypothetical protein
MRGGHMKPDDTKPKPKSKDKVEIRVRVPSDLGLTKEQIKALKERVKVEIVSTTITGSTPQQVLTRVVDDNHIY